ncbi:MAG: hypothetical protein ABII81_09740 [Pseudomonadota bacterium]
MPPSLPPAIPWNMGVLIQRIASRLGWRDVIGIASLVVYLLIAIVAITSVEVGFQSRDSVLMLEMARGERTISASMSAAYILFLRFVIAAWGEGSLIYIHFLSSVVAALMLVYALGRKHLISWIGLWILSLPSYAIFNLMVWKDVLFFHAIIILIAMIITSDRDKLNIRNSYSIIAGLLTVICLIRLNGMAVAFMTIAAFSINRINIQFKLTALTLAVVLSLFINHYIGNHYQVEKSALTTTSVGIRMIEDDYLFYALCVSKESLITPPERGSQIFSGLPRYCDNSYSIDVVKHSLSEAEKKALFDESLSLFTKRPYLWLLVKYKQSNQYLNLKGAFIFPAFVVRLDFLNRPEFKGRSAFHEAIANWMNRNFSKITHYTFQPLWIAIFALYITIRGLSLRFVNKECELAQYSILEPVALFAILYYMSLAIPTMPNDTRYFLPATFISLVMLISTALGDIRLACGVQVTPLIKNQTRNSV